jgi:hypothetical protein
VLVLTALSQAWTLTLSFQLDDYALLWRPVELFRLAAEHETEEVPRFALRWTSWSVWALLHAVLPKPLDPWPYHVVGLGLHLLCTGLVFAIARRIAPDASSSVRDRIGLIAALWFGIQAGGAQAHSWISAWGGLTATVCSLFALRAFLTARDRDESDRLASRLALGFWILLALLSKTPALAVPPLVIWLAVCLPSPLEAPGLGRKRLVREAGAALGALAIALSIRAVYLGNARPRYGDRRPLDPTDIPRVLWNGLENLSQGLIASNKDPLVSDRPHLFPALYPAADIGLVGIGLIAAIFGLWLLSRHKSWRTTLGVAGAMLAAAGPAGAIYAGHTTNVMGRTTYFPLALLAVAVGVALGPAGERPRRGIRFVLAAALLGVWLMGRDDVINVERLADAERRQHRATIERAATEIGEAGVIVLREPPDGFVGVPQLGTLLQGVLQPDFWTGPRPEVRSCTNDRQLRAALADGTLRGRRVAVLVPETNVSSSPSDARAARRLHDVWGRGFTWPESEGITGVTERRDGVQTLDLGGERPPFGFAGLRIDASTTGELVVRYRSVGGALAASVTLEVSEGATVAAAAPSSLDFLLGEPIVAIEFEGLEVEGVQVLFELPRVELEDADWMQAELLLDRTVPLPDFRILAPPGIDVPPVARLTMRVDRTVGETEVYADAPLEFGADRRADFRLDLVHIEPDARPGDPRVFRASWTQAVDRLRELIDNAEGAPSGKVTWAVELLHPDGTPAAASAERVGRYRLGNAP